MSDYCQTKLISNGLVRQTSLARQLVKKEISQHDCQSQGAKNIGIDGIR